MKTSSFHSAKSLGLTFWMVSWPAATMPATNSRVSPGRTGKSTPDSMNTTTSRPINAHGPKYPTRIDGFRKSGIRARLVVVTGLKGTGAGCLDTHCDFVRREHSSRHQASIGPDHAHAQSR